MLLFILQLVFVHGLRPREPVENGGIDPPNVSDADAAKTAPDWKAYGLVALTRNI